MYKQVCLLILIADINECLDANGGCQQMCSNFPGSYSCSCNNGFILNEDNHNCSGMLLNVCMHIHCVYKLKASCLTLMFVFAYFVDVQECRDGLHNCEHICIELDGDFECACNSGFTLESDNASCSGRLIRINIGICLWNGLVYKNILLLVYDLQ